MPPTDSTDSRLFADDHTLQDPWALEVFYILCRLCYTTVLQCVLSENGIEEGKGVTNLVDRLCWRDEQVGRIAEPRLRG